LRFSWQAMFKIQRVETSVTVNVGERRKICVSDVFSSESIRHWSKTVSVTAVVLGINHVMNNDDDIMFSTDVVMPLDKSSVHADGDVGMLERGQEKLGTEWRQEGPTRADRKKRMTINDEAENYLLCSAAGRVSRPQSTIRQRNNKTSKTHTYLGGGVRCAGSALYYHIRYFTRAPPS